jgi:5-methylcytosine-specific restriction endonuclease McrA
MIKALGGASMKEIITQKRCTKCHIIKSANLFTRRKEAKSGIGSWCKECERKRQKEWYSKNPEKGIAKTTRWRNKNIERYRKNLSNWARANKEKKRVNANNYAARKIKNGGKITESQWVALCEKYNNTCLCCGRKDVKLTLDHVVPLKVGGTNSIENAQPLCQSCNSSKGIKIIDYR